MFGSDTKAKPMSNAFLHEALPFALGPMSSAVRMSAVHKEDGYIHLDDVAGSLERQLLACLEQLVHHLHVDRTP